VSGERFVVLGLARVGAPWFSDVARWSTSAALPVEFIKAISTDEAKVRLAAGRPYSALLVDESVVGFDRDLLVAAAERDCAVLVVSGGGPGVALVEPANLLPRAFSRDDLLRALTQTCTPIDRRTQLVTEPAPLDPGFRGQVVTVTGAGGTGRSTVAMGLAQELAADPRRAEQVCLVDGCLAADQGTLHGAPDVVPSVLELGDAHRLGRPAGDDIRSYTWRIDDRGYHLLLGLRQRRDWTALRARSFEAALDGLRRAFGLLVIDTDDDVDGEQATGSLDQDERTAMARLSVAGADVVVAVGTPDLLGVHHLLRVTRDVLALGVPPRAVVPVFNQAPASRRARSTVSRSFGQLLQLSGSLPVASPHHVPFHKGIDLAIRDTRSLPTSWITSLRHSIDGLLRGTEASARPTRRRLVAVRPGELGAWSDAGDAGAEEAT
jgi:hypothetical protein